MMELIITILLGFAGIYGFLWKIDRSLNKLTIDTNENRIAIKNVECKMDRNFKACHRHPGTD